MKYQRLITEIKNYFSACYYDGEKPQDDDILGILTKHDDRAHKAKAAEAKGEGMLVVKLLPCPCCGGKAIVARWPNFNQENSAHYFYEVSCKKCGIGTRKALDKKSVISEWNSRHASAEVEPLAVLADRKGKAIKIIPREPHRHWEISVDYNYDGDWCCEDYFYGPTYHDAEAKARTYLNSLPDREGR